MSEDTMKLLLVLGGLYAVILLMLPFVIWSASNSARKCAERLERIEKLLEYQDKVMRQHDREGGE